MYFFQKTLSREVNYSGVGLHSGENIHVKIRSAPVDSGINFIRIDLPGKPKIKARVSNVIDNTLATVVGNDKCIISTIEHLMAAFFGMSIDNAFVEVNNYEIPVMDGSSRIFLELFSKSGFKYQKKSKLYLTIKKKIKLFSNNKYIIVYPALNYKISSNIIYRNLFIGKCKLFFEANTNTFISEVSCARTFGFFDKIGFLRDKGLTVGGGLKNAVVLSDNQIMNKKRLRFKNEFIKHKILDCIGDLSLVGMPILAHLFTNRSGHKVNKFFIENLLNESFLWKICIFT